MFSYSSIELSSLTICLTVIACSLVTLLVTYYFSSLPCRFYVFTFFVLRNWRCSFERN